MTLRQVVSSAAKIDEVEIDPVELGAAKVRPAQVGFANLLGLSEFPILEIVGIEACARAFAGNITPHEATSG